MISTKTAIASVSTGMQPECEEKTKWVMDVPIQVKSAG